MWRLAFVVGICACSAPRVVVDALDAESADADAAEAATDGGPMCPELRLDGGVCSGPDEDGDCTPDACDSCPAVWDPLPTGTTVVKSGLDRVVGTSVCADAIPPFDTVRTRFFFEPFNDAMRSLKDYAHFSDSALHRDALGFVTIGTSGAGDSAPWAWFTDEDPGAHAVAATAIVESEFGTALLLRVRYFALGDLYDAYGCHVDTLGRKFHPIRANKCGAGGCAAFAEKGAPLPDAIVPDQPYGLRAAVATVDGKVVVDCEVFDPKAPTTLRLAREHEWAVRATYDTDILEKGGIGFASDTGMTKLRALDVQIDQ